MHALQWWRHSERPMGQALPDLWAGPSSPAPTVWAAAVHCGTRGGFSGAPGEAVSVVGVGRGGARLGQGLVRLGERARLAFGPWADRCLSSAGKGSKASPGLVFEPTGCSGAGEPSLLNRQPPPQLLSPLSRGRCSPQKTIVSEGFSKSRSGGWSWYAVDFAVIGSFGQDADQDRQER
jgi:hypothetical protein